MSRLFVTIFWIASGFLLSWGALSYGLLTPVSAAEIEVEKSIDGNPVSVPSGQNFTYVIQYRCASITQDCENMVITDVLPPELSHAAEDVQLLTSPHVQTRNYDSGTATATWTLINPLPAGTTGEVRLIVQFPPGVTLDNTEAINQATITASNASTRQSPPVGVTADAENLMFARKTLLNGTDAPISTGGNDVTIYRLQLCNPNNGDQGGLNMSDIVFTDTLPSGAEFVDASGEGQEISPGVVRWIIAQDEFAAGDGNCLTRYLSVRYPSPPFTTDSADVSNELEITGISENGQNQTLTDSETHGFGVPVPSHEFDKVVNHPYALQGDQIRYGFWIENTGNTTLTNYTITDTIPASLDVTTLWIGEGDLDVTVTVQYQTNLNGTWLTIPGGAVDLPSGGTHSVEVNTLGLAVGEYLTQVRWVYATLPVTYDAHNDNLNRRTGITGTILNTDRNGNPVDLNDLITNNAVVDFTYNGDAGDSINDTVTVTVSNGPSPQISKALLDDPTVQPGDQVNVRLTLTNEGSGLTSLINPTVGDLLPAGLRYVPNSWTMSDSAGTAPQPNLSVTTNYNGSGRTFVRWSWGPGNPLTIVGGPRVITIDFKVEVITGTSPGSLTNVGNVVDYDNQGINTDACLGTLVDTHDLDNDGNTTESLCASESVDLTVAPLALLGSEKLVKGALDTGWTKYPQSGRTTPGGVIDYRLRITNLGNIPMHQLIIADVLPIPDDTGIIDEQPRESIWRPYFERITAMPSEATVGYSTTNDPCLPELDLPTDSCTAPNWQPTAANAQEIRSIKFSLNGYQLDPGEMVELRVRLRAPSTDLPEYGSITWNSFAYIAQWADGSSNMLLASEPIKVGVSLEDSLANTGESAVVPALVIGAISVGGWLSFRRRQHPFFIT